jgi:excisionase family DNA binding protein
LPQEASTRVTQPTQERKTLTLQEVCDILRVTRRTATGLIGRGELTAFKVGQAWRVDARDLDAFIERQKHAAHHGRHGGRGL